MREAFLVFPGSNGRVKIAFRISGGSTKEAARRRIVWL